MSDHPGNEKNAMQLSESRTMAIAGIVYAIFLAYLTAGLRFNMLCSDVLGYWKDSLRWQAAFGTWWVPGYSLLIAALRGATFNALPPIAVMVLLSAAAYLLGVSATFRIALHSGFPSPAFPALIFAFFPFAGLTYSVYPIADGTAIAAFLLSVLAFEKGQWARFILLAGASMLLHKVMWFFVPPVALLAFVRHKGSRLLIPLAFVPVLLWGAAGALYHRDPAWFIHWSVDNLLTSKTAFSIFDGLITPLISHSFAKIAKGTIVAIIFTLVLCCLYSGWRRKLWLPVCVAFSLLMMIAFVNSYEIWSVVRFSKLLVIPLSILPAGPGLRTSLLSHRAAVPATFAFLIISNAAFGYYLARAFFQ